MKYLARLPILICLLFWLGCVPPEYREARYLMGTLVEVEIFGVERERAMAAAARAFDAVKRVDELMSTYKETSEISQINHEAYRQPVIVSEETFFVLEWALEMSRASGGAFDITVGPLVRLWGFDRKEGKGKIPSAQEIKKTQQLCGYQKVILNREEKSVRLKQEKMELDLGGIAKGYAVDLALEALRQEGIKAACVSTGSNLGYLGHPKNKQRWKIGVKDPKKPEKIIDTLEVGEEAVSTSGSYENFFEVDGKKYSHILDPRTGWPVDNGVLSVTVVAPRGIDADALSTALFVLGPEKGFPLARRFDTKAFFIFEEKDGTIRTLNHP